jgi:predicted dehydrogenase
VALIGAGAMGGLHARVVDHSEETELALVVDRNPQAAALLAEPYDAEWSTDIDDLAAYDAIIVASPTRTHLEWGLRALDAGRPVLVEKPLSEDFNESCQLINAARAHDTPLMAGLLERYNATLRTAMDIALNPLQVMFVRHSPYVPRINSGVAHDLLIHDVDLSIRLAGEFPEAVSSQFAYCHPKSDRGAEDVAEVTLRFPSGMLASLSASRVSQHKVRTLIVTELERLIEVDMVRDDVTVYRHVLNENLENSGPGYRQQMVIDIPAIRGAREPLVSQLDRFVALARGEEDYRSELDSLLAPHWVVAEAARIARDPQVQRSLRIADPLT